MDARACRTAVEIVRGQPAILDSACELQELAERSGLRGVVDDIAGWLPPARVAGRIPYLVKIRAERNQLCGAVLLTEATLAGIGLGVFLPVDVLGKRCVLAASEIRGQVAVQAAAALLVRGAHLVHTTMAAGAESEEGGIREALIAEQTWNQGQTWSERQTWIHGQPRRWALRERMLPMFLDLTGGASATLARVGKKTRTNLRYYQRKAERELGCTFVPAALVTSAELQAFNKRCMYPVSQAVARWRSEAMAAVKRPVFCGIRDDQGQWLALLGGRRHNRDVTLDWQMNRSDLPRSSLGTVLRAMLIDYEAELGTERLYIDGGTKHSLQHSFLLDHVAEFTMIRRSMRLSLLRRYLTTVLDRPHTLGHLLSDPQLQWQT